MDRHAECQAHSPAKQVRCMSCTFFVSENGSEVVHRFASTVFSTLIYSGGPLFMVSSLRTCMTWLLSLPSIQGVTGTQPPAGRFPRESQWLRERGARPSQETPTYRLRLCVSFAMPSLTLISVLILFFALFATSVVTDFGLRSCCVFTEDELTAAIGTSDLCPRCYSVKTINKCETCPPGK